MDKLKMDRSKNIFIRRIGFMLVALIGLLLALAVQAADSTQLSGHKGDVNSVAVSADGTLVVSGSSDNQVKVWSGGGEVATRESTQGLVTAVSSSPDGKLVAVGSMYGDVTLWDRVTGKDLYSKRGHETRITAVSSIERESPGH